MRTIELFAGTKSFSKIMAQQGHSTLTVDNDAKLEPDICGDIRTVSIELGKVDVLWASPPCQGFSVAAIGKNWNHDNTPKTDSARLGIELALRTLDLISRIQPTWYFIENPRGKLRKMDFMINPEKTGTFLRVTVTYCQYGDTRMKPTDIWTNAWWWRPKPPCKNGAGCHEAAPRGSSTGTQGIDGAKDRGRIPPALFEEILRQMPDDTKKKIA